MDHPPGRDLDRAAALLAAASRVVVSTGAGMSAESGIPTFRDALEGLWARFDPAALATEDGFRADPRRVWSWYAWRRGTIAACAPHAGHRAVAELQRLHPHVTLVTQNVDGLHAAAGSPEVVELHGSIRRLRCLDRGHPHAGEVPVTPGAELGEEDPPPCAACGSPLRPDVVWFGEVLPQHAVARAWAAAEACGVLLLVGTSGTVWPAAELPLVAKRAGAAIVEVNPAPSELTPTADLFLRGRAGDVLPELVRRVRALRGAAPPPG
jgi:NAD-dependent deacetylase